VRIALTGPTGQLGTDLRTAPGDNIIPLFRPEFELDDDDAIRRSLDDARPELVINTAAYNLVDRAEDEPDVAFRMNAFAVRTIAQWCASQNATLVHFSSDYVFGLDRTRQRPYTEDDTPGPLSVYAASKLQGEYFVRSLCPKHFVIRTCGLFGVAGAQGAGKGNFIETMLRLGAERDELTVVNDQHCTPTATIDLVAATVELIGTKDYGLYHATNSGSTTWFDLATEVLKRSGIDTPVLPVSSEQFGAKACRPGYSILDCSKLESVIGRTMPPWQDAVDRYLVSRAAAVD
jgi:dTDP-4-dehydrorhamnose reductase